MKIFKSFKGLTSKKVPDYECTELLKDGYKLKVSFYKNNPDLSEYIQEKETNGFTIRLVELKSSAKKDDVIDVWVKNNSKEREFYKAEDLAELLEVNIMTIYRYIKAKKLKAYKIGREFRIDKNEFQLFLTNSPTK